MKKLDENLIAELLEILLNIMESKSNIEHYLGFDKSLLETLNKAEKLLKTL